MLPLSRLRSLDRYSSSSGRLLEGPLLQSYHGSPRHSYGRYGGSQPWPRRTSARGVLLKVALLTALAVACWQGFGHVKGRLAAGTSGGSSGSDAPYLAADDPAGLSTDASKGWSKLHTTVSDLGWKLLERLGKREWLLRDADAAGATHAAGKKARAGRWVGSEHPPLKLSQSSMGGRQADGSVQASAGAQAAAAAAAVPGAYKQPPAAAPPAVAQHADPLHDTFSDKEAEQLSALSNVIQQQQDTITRQAAALQDLQKRFMQQEHQLEAATASSATTADSEQVQVENYFPEAKVQLELSMLHKVEAQIESVSKTIDEARKAMPLLTAEQQAVQREEVTAAEEQLNRLSRVAAAINLRTSDPLTESGHDPVADLRHYYGKVAAGMTLDWQEALRRQARPTSASLGLHMDPFTDSMADLETLDVRMEYAANMMQGMAESAPCSIGLATTWSGDLWGLRKELVPWLTYHAYLGVSRLFVLYEGSDARTLMELRALAPWVTVILASAPLAAPADIAAYEAWVQAVPDAHIRQWKEQPGNYALMTKQGYAVTTALSLAKAAKVSWLIHLDPDELLHPGASHSAGVLAGSYSLLPELCATPSHVPSIRFVNIEGVPEAADLTNRYEQVTLFRSHRHLVPPQIQPFRYIFKQGHSDAWLHLYTNGKSAVRPDAPGVTQGGPHVFLGPADKRWATPDNPHGVWKPAISNSTLVLHYAYATPGDVAVKAGRSCPPGVVEAVLAGDASKASQCFVLDLDQRAFLAAVRDRHAAGLPPVPASASAHQQAAASAGSGVVDAPGGGGSIVLDAATFFGGAASSGLSNSSWPVGHAVLDFFWGELALSEGAPFECLAPDGKSTGWCSMRGVDALKSLLISSGLMMRLHAPAQTMKGIETAIQQLMLSARHGTGRMPGIVLRGGGGGAGGAGGAGGGASSGAAAGSSSSGSTDPEQQQRQQQQQGRGEAGGGSIAEAAAWDEAHHPPPASDEERRWQAWQKAKLRRRKQQMAASFPTHWDSRWRDEEGHVYEQHDDHHNDPAFQDPWARDAQQQQQQQQAAAAQATPGTPAAAPRPAPAPAPAPMRAAATPAAQQQHQQHPQPPPVVEAVPRATAQQHTQQPAVQPAVRPPAAVAHPAAAAKAATAHPVAGTPAPAQHQQQQQHAAAAHPAASQHAHAAAVPAPHK